MTNLDMFDGAYRFGPRFDLPLPFDEMRRQDRNCPRCRHHVQLYKRTLGEKLFKFLGWLIGRCPGDEWANRLDAPLWQGTKGGGDYGKLQLWRMIERPPKARGQNTTGLWRPLPLGRRFFYGNFLVPKYAYEYRSELWDYEEPWIYPWDALKLTRFSYTRLLAGEGSYFEE